MLLKDILQDPLERDKLLEFACTRGYPVTDIPFLVHVNKFLDASGTSARAEVGAEILQEVFFFSLSLILSFAPAHL